MNKKTKVLATSIATIAMTASLAVGGTYALFTSEDKVNVAVTSGTVEVLANIVESSFATSSSLSTFTGTTAFELGGTVAYNTANGTITLDKMTPGDKVTFNLDLVNNSNVGIQYRVVMTMDGVLGEVLKANAVIDGVDYKFSSIGATKWVAVEDPEDVSKSINVETKTDDVAITIALPEEVGNTYQNKSANLSVKVEAVQGNAQTSNATLVNSQATLQNAIDNGDEEIALSGDIELTSAINVKGNVKIDGEGAVLERANGYTGTVFNVEAGANFELTNVEVDGGANWTNNASGISTLAAKSNEVVWGPNVVNTGVTATGALVNIPGASTVTLGADVVLENNDGANAISLAKSGNGTLIFDGATVQYNRSAAGAVWAGGVVVINEGTKINYNIATSIGGAFRMVSTSKSFTMNGGEINYNYSASTGGAIWGGNNTKYYFNGGEMAYNESEAGGGAIWTGTYESYYISGDFKLHDNKSKDLGGAIRFRDHASLTMTGGFVYNNTVNGKSAAFYLNNNTATITGGTIEDNFSYSGGLGLTIGNATINGLISFDLGTNHNTAYLAENFGEVKFTVNEGKANFSQFNFKPYEGYVYTAGDEAKFICMNEGYETYWDTATKTFRLQAKA